MKAKKKITPPEHKMYKALEKYLATPVLLQSVTFVYALDLEAECICFQKGLATFLGYDVDVINLGFLVEMLHPDERTKLARLEIKMQDFLYAHPTGKESFSVSVIHQLRKVDGSYAKIWRRVHPFLGSGAGNGKIMYSLCQDASCLGLTDKLSFQVLLPPHVKYDSKILNHFFCEFLSEDSVKFTKRQLDALRVWSETDSLKLGAERLGLQIRTLETHLKLARQRIGVRRTIDALVYAQRNGWL